MNDQRTEMGPSKRSVNHSWGGVWKTMIRHQDFEDASG